MVFLFLCRSFAGPITYSGYDLIHIYHTASHTDTRGFISPARDDHFTCARLAATKRAGYDLPHPAAVAVLHMQL